jgi:hypothetical protein
VYFPKNHRNDSDSIDAHWLLIFDDVENIETISHIWPSNSHAGSIIVTTRNTHLTSVGVNVLVDTLSEEDGTQYLLNLLPRNRYNVEEIEAARSLSEQMSGLPLALSALAAYAQMSQMLLKDLLSLYLKRGEEKLLSFTEKSYGLSLQATWLMSFKHLSPTAFQLMGVFSVWHPDNILQQLLESKNSDSPFQDPHR